jgi:ankyrin repeat protein
MPWKKVKKVAMSVHFQIFVVVMGIGMIVTRYSKSVSDATDLPIVRASAMGDYDTVKTLLKKGVTPNCVDESLDGPLAKSGPLALAVWNSNIEMCQKVVELLLLYNADIRARDLLQQCPIHKIIKIDYTNPDFDNIRGIDFQNARMDILSKLIKWGADIHARDDRQSSFLDLIVELNDFNFVGQILDTWGKILNPQIIGLALQRANDRMFLDTAAMIQKGARTIIMDVHWDPRIIDSKTGLSDLHCAVIKNDKSLAQAVLAKNVSPNTPSEDSNGFRPLHFAVHHRLPAMVRFLLEKGADVNGIDKYGNTPLLYVASIPDTKIAGEIAQDLLDHDANLNAVNNDHNALLHMLILLNNRDLIELIGKDYVFDQAIKNADFETAQDLAKKLNRQDLLNNIK